MVPKRFDVLIVGVGHMHEKIALILATWVGRLEIIPVLVFLRKVLPLGGDFVKKAIQLDL